MKNKFAKANGGMIAIVVGIILGSVLGVWMASDGNTGDFNILSLDTLLFMLLWVLISTFLHELGHMLFGFITGYKFVYFKLFGIMICKYEGKWKALRGKMHGTIGQCLMKPDFDFTPKMPYKLYNLGGCLANLLLAGMCLAMMIIYPQNPFVVAGLIVNGIFAIVNILPIKSMRSDGYNAISIGKTTNSKRAYWLELKLADDTLQCKKFSDMPQKYFEFEVEDLSNPDVCVALYMQYCYLICTNQFDKASQLILELFNQRVKMPLSNANTVAVEYFNNLVLYQDNMAEATKVYNNFDASVKNAIQRVPIPFTLVSKILINGMTVRNESLFDLDCKVLNTLLDQLPNGTEAEYINIIFRQAKQKYYQLDVNPFDM